MKIKLTKISIESQRRPSNTFALFHGWLDIGQSIFRHIRETMYWRNATSNLLQHEIDGRAHRKHSTRSPFARNRLALFCASVSTRTGFGFFNFFSASFS
jgi:hypothetical protein